MQVNDNLTYDEYVVGLKTFKWMRQKLSVGLADYIAWGINKFGKEKLGDALEQLEFDMPIVERSIAIASVPTNLRRASLTGEHYTVLAKASTKLPTTEVAKWADVAEKEHMTPSQLKASINAGTSVTPAVAKQQQTGMITVQGLRGEFDIWMRRMGGVDGIRKLEKSVRDEILNELRPIAELVSSLS